MGGRGTPVAVAVAAAALLIAGLLTAHWWTADAVPFGPGGGINIGLHSVQLCTTDGACMEISMSNLGGNASATTFAFSLASRSMGGWFRS